MTASPRPSRPRAGRRSPETLLADALALGRAGPPLLNALLALLDEGVEVRFDDALPTAALMAEGDGFVIAIGGRAIDNGKLDAADILYLIAHELCHLVRDEHRLPDDPRTALAMNLAADAVNDAWLTGPAFEGFFSPLTALPARRPPTHPANGLLIPLRAANAALGAADEPAPPASVSRRFFEEVITPPAPGGRAPYRAASWASTHHLLQVGGRDATLPGAMALELVLPLLDQLPDAPVHPGHMALAELLGTAAGRRRLEALRRAFGEASEAEQQAGGAGSGGALELVTVARAAPLRRLEVFLRKLATESRSQACQWSPVGPRAVANESGSRVAGRPLTEWVAGMRASPFADHRHEGGDLPIGLELYLDTSGSMYEELPRLVASLATVCSDLLSLPVRTFSIGVHPVGLEALRSGNLPSEGGTSFSAVARDLLARRVSHAIIISDGEGPPLPGDLASALQQRRTRVAQVFPLSIGKSPFDAFCPSGWRLGLDLKGAIRL